MKQKMQSLSFNQQRKLAYAAMGAEGGDKDSRNSLLSNTMGEAATIQEEHRKKRDEIIKHNRDTKLLMKRAERAVAKAKPADKEKVSKKFALKITAAPAVRELPRMPTSKRGNFKLKDRDGGSRELVNFFPHSVSNCGNAGCSKCFPAGRENHPKIGTSTPRSRFLKKVAIDQRAAMKSVEKVFSGVESITMAR